jgi:hypothetical protein
MRRSVLLSLALVMMSACRGDDATRPNPTDASSPNPSISDATHCATPAVGCVKGNPDFFWLLPLVPDPMGTPTWRAGAANPDLSVSLDICELSATSEAQIKANPDAAACKAGGYALSTTVGSKNISFGPLDDAEIDALRYFITHYTSFGEPYYHYGWMVPVRTAPWTAPPTFFRVRTSVGSKQLGYLDFEQPNNLGQLFNITTGQFVPLLGGIRLPINFRVQNYALCEVPGVGPCATKAVDLVAGGTVATPLTATGLLSGITFPAAPPPPPGSPPPPTVAVTVQGCTDLHVREVTDLPTFGPCVRVIIEPALTAPLVNPALVFSCDVTGAAVAAGVLNPLQAERIALHRLTPSGNLEALGHADPVCTPRVASTPTLRGMLAALAHGQVKSAAKQIGALLLPKPLYAARFIDLGGGGITLLPPDVPPLSIAPVSGARLAVSPSTPTSTINDFQFALPAKFQIDATPTGLSGPPGSTFNVSVKVTDLGGAPVQFARVRFSADNGGTVNNAVVPSTNPLGFAEVVWTLGTTPGANILTAKGRGIAGSDRYGPRVGVNPFQPLHTHWGDASNGGPVAVLVGSMTVTATGRVPTGTISGTVLNAYTNAPIAGATVTATPTPPGMATEASELPPISATTGADGTFRILDIPPGSYDVTTAAPGFVSALRSAVIVTAGVNTPLGSMKSAPVATEGSVRIVLDWGACSLNTPPGGAPCDLDSHLTGPTATGTRFHVYYPLGSRSFSDAASAATLDVDVRTGLGPETITLTRQITGGDYRYFVHDYSAYCCAGPAITVSSARVRVFFGASAVPTATYTVPLTGTGALWEVFSLSGTTLTPINVIRTVPNPSSVGLAAVAAVPVDPELQRIADDLARAVKTP